MPTHLVTADGVPFSTYRGDWDPTTGSFPSGADSGDIYRVSANGTVDGETFTADQLILSISDTPSTTTFAGSWLTLNGSLSSTVDDGFLYLGTWNPASAVFPGTGTAQTGEVYLASGDGIVDGVQFYTDDLVVAILDNASTTTYAANWQRIPGNENRAHTVDVTQTAHGFTLPAHGFIPVYYDNTGGQYEAAIATSVETLTEAYIVGIPDANTLRLQMDGIVNVPAHGLTAATGILYLSESVAGDFQAAKPATFANPIARALDANNIRLIDNAPITEISQDVYQQSFLVADWVLNAPYYELTVTQAMHNLSDLESYRIWQTVGTDLVSVIPEQVAISASDDITFRVLVAPDGRFDGQYVLYGNPVNTDDSFTANFTAAGSWTQNGSFYEYSVPNATHGVTGPRFVDVFNTTTGDAVQVFPEIIVEADSDVVVRVNFAPDGRFTGTIYIQ